MGTRGLYGFHKNGIDKLTYNHLGSYPDSLGKKIVEFCKCAGRDGMNSLFDHIELVSEDAKPTPKQIEYCMAHDLGVDGGDWYWTLRPNQGCPENWLPLLHVTKREIDLTVQRGGVIFQDVLSDWSIEPDATIHVWRFPESESEVMTSEFRFFMLGLLTKIKAGTIWKSPIFILGSLNDHQV